MKNMACEGKRKEAKKRTMQRVISIIACLILVLVSSLSGFADVILTGGVQEVQAAIASGGMHENMYWEISDGGVLTVRPSGGKSYGRWIDNRYTNGTVAGGWPWKAHAESITEVKIQGTIGSSPNTDLKNMFSDLPNVTKIDISGFNFGTNSDGSQGDSTRHTIRNLDNMFSNCPKLTEIVGLDVLAHSSVTSTNEMFKDCTSLTTADFNSLDMSNVQTAKGMFQNCSSLTELDLSNWINNGKMYQMQDLANGCSKLKKFTLNNSGFETRVVKSTTNAANYKNTTNVTGCQSQRMFTGCDALEVLDLSNITISTWQDPYYVPSDPSGTDEQNTFIRSIGGTNSDGLPNLRVLNMTNIKLPGLKAGVLGGELVHGKRDNLEEFYFGGNIDIDDSIKDTTHDIKYRSGLEEIVDKLIENCTDLKVVDLSGWDTSNLQELGTNPNFNNEYTTFGFRDLINNGNFGTLIAENAKIWMHYKEPESSESTISDYDISDNLTPDKLKKLYIDWVFDFNTTTDDSGTDVIDLDSNANDAEDLRAVIGGESGYITSGRHTPSNTSKYEPWVDENDNSRIPKTYYLVNNFTNSSPSLYYKQGDGAYTLIDEADDYGDYHVEFDRAYGGYRIFSRMFPISEDNGGVGKTWDEIQAAGGKLDDSVKLKIVYPRAATDVNGKLHDVVIDIDSVTFKDMDLIPTIRTDAEGNYIYKVDPYGVNPWGTGEQTNAEGEKYTFTRTDQKRLVGTNPTTGQFDGTQTYTRELIGALDGRLDFWNQIYTTFDGSRATDPNAKKLSKGSGTYIDYRITVDDALPDTSVLYWVGDLDVAHSQEWEMDSHDMNLDTMKSDAYGPGAEGIVLRSGNDLSTLTFANNTGLKRYQYDDADYSQSTPSDSGNYIVGTATDPDTSWSRFYLRADSQGSNYTWTSGISCKTTILRNSPLEHDMLPQVYVIPEATKTVNGTTPAGEYENAFTFNIERAEEIKFVPYTYTYMSEDMGENATEVPAKADLPNSVPADYFQVVKNDASVVPLPVQNYFAPGSIYEQYKYDHPYNEHLARAYIYRITEVIPNDADNGVMDYNKKKAVHYLQVIVSDPKTDLEMHKGIRADVLTGTYYYTGDTPTYPDRYDKIDWDETPKTIWSQDAVLAGTDIDTKDTLGSAKYPLDSAILYQRTTPEGYLCYRGIYGGSSYCYQDNQGQWWNSLGEKIDESRVNKNNPVMLSADTLVGKKVYEDASGNSYYYDGQVTFRYVNDSVFRVAYTPQGKQAAGSSPVFTDATGKEFYRNGGEFASAQGGQTMDVAGYEQTPTRVEYDADGDGTPETYTVKVDANGTKYVKVPKYESGTDTGKSLYLDPETLNPDNALQEADKNTVFPTADDQVVAQKRKVKVGEAECDVQIDVHGKTYVLADGKYYAVTLKDDGTAELGDELTVEDSVFNPDTTDRFAYKGKTIEYNGTTYTVKTDALGTEYFEVPGTAGAASTYRSPEGEKDALEPGSGQVSPSNADKDVEDPFDRIYAGMLGSGQFPVDDDSSLEGLKVYRDSTDQLYYVIAGTAYKYASVAAGRTVYNPNGKAFVVNGHTIYETQTGNKTRYYRDTNGNYYSVLGTILTLGTNFSPEDDDPVVTGDYDIRQDENGTLFYKGEGTYKPDGTYEPVYYELKRNTDGTYITVGEYTVPATILDTSEAINVGPFENTAKISEIEIENKAEDDKAGIFTFEIEFDNDFEPTATNVVFDAVTPLEGDEKISPQFKKTGDRKYKFTLTEGQKVTIKNVPFQTTYTVTRKAEKNGWEVVSADGDTNATSVTKKITQERYQDDGSKNPDWDNSHTFVNRFTELVVKKVVEGGDHDEKFEFAATATISGFGAGEEFSYGYIDEKNDQHFKTAKANDSGEATVVLDGFTLQDKKDLEDIVLVLPRGDGDEGNRKVEVKVTELNSNGYWTTWKLDNGTKADVDANGATDPIAMNTDKQVLTFINRRVIGTVGLDLQKLLDGRVFKDGDKFSFMLTAEDGTPMPVTWDAANGEFKPTATTADLGGAGGVPAGNVSAKADLGIIKYMIDDLDEVEITFDKATESQKAAATSWTSADGKTTYKPDAGNIPSDAKTTIREKTFVYQIMENPTDSKTGDPADSKPIANDAKVAEVKVRVQWNPRANDGKGAFIIDGQDATLYYDQANNKFVDNNDKTGDFRAMANLEDVFFTNVYTSTGIWTPEAIKVLNGRPLERDQFNFKLKGVEDKPEEGATAKWVKTNPPMPGSVAEGATADDSGQDVAKATADPKGTSDVNGPVSFENVTFTNEWLKKTDVKSAITDKSKVIQWEWTSGGKTYIYGPIPDDAKANVTVDGQSTGDEGVKYADATDAQRAAAKGTTLDTAWQKGGKYYIAPGTYTKTTTDNTDPDNPVTTTSEVDNIKLVPDTATGTYYETSRTLTYKMWEVDGRKDGYTYDTHKDEASAYEIKVKITDQQDGTIKVEADKQATDLKFTNTYDAEGKITVTATKELTGRALKADEFTFTLKNSKGETVATAKNAADGSITFTDAIVLTEADFMSGTDYDALRTPDGFYRKDFVYTVEETGPTADGDGITRDTSVKTLVITVQEDGEGNMKVVAVNNKAQDGGNVDAGTFNNQYSASGTGEVKATKTLNSGKLAANDFNFELYDNKGTKVAESANDADGNVKFTVQYDTAKLEADKEAGICTYADGKWTYTYTVKELEETSREDKITYDSAAATGKTVTVKVTDNGTGTLTATQTTADVSFTNTVDPISITGTKVWKDTDASKTHNTATELNGKLKLQRVSGTSTTPETVPVANPITLTWNGNTYTYSGLPKYDTQGNEYTYFVTEATVDGYMPAVYTNTDGTTTDKALDGGTITNSVTPAGQITLKAKKILKGSTRLEDWAGNPFKVTGTATAPNYTTDPVNVPTTGKLEKSGDDVVSTATFDLATLRFKVFVEDEKNFIYLVDADGKKLGKHYVSELTNGQSVIVVNENELDGSIETVDQKDAKNKNIILNISDNGDGTLKVVPATNYTDTAELVNDHDATVKAEIPITKELKNRDLEAGEFSFTATYKPDTTKSELDLERLASGFTAPAAVKNDANGDARFVIEFSKTGTYTFVIAETNDGKGGITYDDSTYEVTVTVTNDNGELKTAVTGANNIKFTNSYKATGSVTLSVTKALEGTEWDDEMNFWFKIDDVNGVFGTDIFSPVPSFNKDNRVATRQRPNVPWTINGFTLDNAFNDNGTPKTFRFNITEINPNHLSDEDWVLDTTTHTATVTFTDNGDGTLTPTVKYDVAADGTGGTDTLTVTNIKKGQGRNLHATKQVVDAEGASMWKTGDTYTLQLKALEGAPMPSGTTDGIVTKEASQTAPQVDFGTIVFDTPGTYTYEISEPAPETKISGVTYDTKTYKAVVTVADAGSGNPGEPVVKYYDGDTELDAAPTIKNVFDAEGEVALTARKVLNGGNLSQFVNDFTFTLYEANGITVAKDKSGAEIKNVKANADGSINLGTIAYGEDDLDLRETDGSKSFTYILREDIPADDAKKAGVTYDTSDKRITVTLKLDGSEASTGVAKIVPTQSETPTLTNTYAPTGTVELAVMKHLFSRPITRAGFYFDIEGLGTVESIESKDWATIIGGFTSGTVPMPSHTNVHIAANTVNYSEAGYANFDIAYDMSALAKTGGTGYDNSRIFVYKVTEQQGPNAAIDYATSDVFACYAFVTVTNDTDEGKLKTEVTYVEASRASENDEWTYKTVQHVPIANMKFVNVYKSEGTANVNAIKQILEPRKWTTKDEFTFVIKPAAVDGVYGSFGGGTNKFDITDPTWVPLPGNDPKSVDTRKDYESEPLTRDAIIGNGGKTEATAKATINGRDVGNGEHFSDFDKPENAITFTDDMLTFDSTDGYLKGTFYYEISEQTPGNGFTQTGDVQTFYARVDVVDNRTGGITHNVYYFNKDEDMTDLTKQNYATPVFQNEYEIDDTVELPFTKVIDGREWKEDDSFKFTISSLNGAPMPDEPTLTINSDVAHHAGTFSAPVTMADLTSITATNGELKYTDNSKVPANVRYAKFRYQIAEANAGETHGALTYGDGIYAEVLVIDKLNGKVDEQVTYYRDSSFAENAKLDSGIITNVYDAFGVPATIEVTKAVKDGEDADAWDKLPANAEFTFTIEPLNDAPTPKEWIEDSNLDELPTKADDTELKATASAKSDKVSVPIRMSDLKKDENTGEPKTTDFIYKVTEQSGNITAVSYDTRPVYVKVTATPDNTAKTVALTYKYYADDACTDELTFEDGLTITNTYGVTDLTVAKEWNDGGKTNHHDIAVTLMQAIGEDGEMIALDTLPAGAKVLDKNEEELSGYGTEGITVSDNKLPIKFTNLPAVTADGTEIIYNAEEGYLDGYQSSTKYVAAERTVTFTNTELTSVHVTKSWNDGGSDEAIAARPEVVIFGLIKNGGFVPIEFITVSLASDWSAEFTGLEAYNEKGDLNTYTVMELGVPADYASEVTGDAENGFTITNTKLSDIEVSKTWIGGAAADVEFKLYRATEPSEASAYRTVDGRKTWTVDNSWEEVGAYTFASSEFIYSTTGDTKSYTFADLPAFNAEGKAYQYRVKETTESSSFIPDQKSDLAVTNTNNYESSGIDKVSTIKALSGRDWIAADEDAGVEGDTFYFKIEPVNGTDVDGTEVVAKDDVPLPMDGQEVNDIATVTASSTKVGNAGRSVDFGSISFTNKDMLNTDGSKATTRYFNYKVYEVNADGTAVTDGKGITYDKTEYTLRIVVTDNGEGKLATANYWDGNESTDYVPVFTNNYSSEGTAYIYIEKDIHRRAWTDTDAFTFHIAGVSGASVNVDGKATAYDTRPMQLSDTENLLQINDNLVAMGIRGSKYTSDMLNNGEATFIYEITENAGSVSDLSYDKSRIYLQLKATDNWDGTISFEARYFSDAACTNEITDHTVNVDAEGKLVAADTEGATQVNVAHFTNTLSTDINVKKVWVGQPLEDVTVRLQRALLTPNADGSALTPEQIDQQIAAQGENAWIAVERLEIPRGDFVDAATGNPNGNEPGSTDDAPISSKTYTVRGMPMFVDVNGTTMRAVYRIVEEDTSDAYDTSYGVIRDGIYHEDERIYEQRGGTLVVTNTASAENTASIAAVKQLIGRQWRDDDVFEFRLEPIGKASYNEKGEINGIVETTDIPMPDNTIAQTTLVPVVDDDHEKEEESLERLARFGTIEYKVEHLVYDPTDRHHQGDFFYKLTEVHGDDKSITYSEKISTVHVKVRENRTDNLTVQVSYDETTQGDVATGTQFTPVFTNIFEPEKTNVTVTKVWDGEPEDIGTSLRSDVTLHLYGTVDGKIVYDAGSQTISKDAAGEALTVTWEVPVSLGDDQLSWKVVEDAVPGYTWSVAPAPGEEDAEIPDSFVVTNTFAEATTSVTAGKVWEDNNNVDGMRPQSVTFELWKKVGTNEPELVEDQTQTIGEAQGWTYTWNDLPVVDHKYSTSTSKQDVEEQETDTDGNKLYKLINSDAGSGTGSDSGTGSGSGTDTGTGSDSGSGSGSGTDTGSGTGSDTGSDSGSDTGSGSGSDTGSGSDSLKEKITETEYNDLSDEEKALYGPSMITKQIEVTEETYESDDPVLYFVKEQGVNGYTGIVQATAPGEFEIVNIHMPFTKDITVKKAWSDNDNADGIRPSYIAFRLLADGTKVADGMLSADNNWAMTFTDMPVNAEGKVSKPVVYTVEETAVEGYEPSYSGDGTAENPLVITNVHSPADKLALSVTKAWAGEDGDTSARKDVVLHLMKVVEGYGPIKVDGQDKTISKDAQGADLTVTWTDLPSRENGRTVTYTVEEDPIEGYSTSYSDGTVSGNTISITVTNTKKSVDPKPEPQPEPDKIVIRYIDPTKPEGEQEVVRETINKGDNEPAQPDYSKETRDGYVFGGWIRNVDANGNVSYTAKWIKKSETPDPSITSKPKILYIDPHNDSSMILLAREYDTQDEADKAAEGRTGKPKDPSHAGYTFTGWVVDKDKYGDYVFVAKYNENVKSDKKTITYVDSQADGDIVIKSKVVDADVSSIKAPKSPSHNGLKFVRWEKSEDANGNIVLSARYEPVTKEKIVEKIVYRDRDPVIKYVEKPVYINQNPNQTIGNQGKTPNTGDSTDIGFLIALMGAALGMIAFVLIRQFRQRED